jgi:hypothetical protein
MNESSESISRTNEEEKTKEYWEQQWQVIPCLALGFTTKVDPNVLCETLSPSSSHTRPSLIVMSISHGLANKQTCRKKNDITITIKRATRTFTFFFLLQMMDVWFATKKWKRMIFITMALLWSSSPWPLCIIATTLFGL